MVFWHPVRHPVLPILRFVMHLRLRLVSNCNHVIVCCHSFAFGRRYATALCASLLLLLLLSFCLSVGLIVSLNCKTAFHIVIHHSSPTSPSFTITTLRNTKLDSATAVFSSPSCNSLRTHAHTHSAPSSAFFPSHFSTLLDDSKRSSRLTVAN